MRYRREIDGLRAVAVLPVMLYHAGASVWSGGYVGVDVFFVISGYLITTILIEQRERGTYSVLGFYERRARRILPALFVVLLSCVPFAWVWLPPSLFKDFAASMAAAALFVSNFHFQENGGYFDLAAEMRPLIHTWSLAVEEQYYLLFPLVLVALGRFRRRRFLIGFALLAVLSLGLAEWGWRHHPDKNFYFTPSRLWELMAGALCAALLFRRDAWRSEVLAAIGLAAILYAAVAFDNAVPFPSVFTLVPVLGTCLVILFGRSDTLTARVLSLRPLVGIGLISYSAYLWHQPILAFARIRVPEGLPDGVMMALALGALPLAWASWRFVEQPFRGRAPRLLPGRARLFAGSLAGIAVLAALGVAGARDGFAGRLEAGRSSYLDRLYRQITERPLRALCPNTSKHDARPLCPVPAAGGDGPPARRLAVLGDSHARALLPALPAISEALDERILLGDVPGCPPMLGVYLTQGGRDAIGCHDAMRDHVDEIVAQGTGTVLLVARWSAYATGGYEGADPNARLTRDSNRRRVSKAEWRTAFQEGLSRMLARLRAAGIEVVIVAQVPQQKVDPTLLVERAMMAGLSETAARRRFRQSFVSRAQNDRLQAEARALIGPIAGQFGARVVTLDSVFAQGGHYAWLRQDDALYHDDDHVSETGALRLAPDLISALRRDGVRAAGDH